MQQLRTQANGLNSDAAGIQAAAQNAFEEETRIARETLQNATTKANAIFGEATIVTAAANKASTLLAKYI